MGKNKKLKKPKHKINTIETEKYKRGTNDTPPAFSFEELQPSHDLGKCEDKEKIALLRTIVKLSKTTWGIIQKSGRHGLGHEIIDRSQIKVGIPQNITKEQKILSFRFYNMRPFVGYRIDKIFYILWIDPKGSIYNH